MTYQFPEISFENLLFLEHALQKRTLSQEAYEKSWSDLYYSLQSEPAITTTNPRVQEARIEQLIDAFRTWGYMEASIYPKGLKEVHPSPFLTAALERFAREELDRFFPTCGFTETAMLPLREIIDLLKKTYCHRIGIEYMYMCAPEVVRWIQKTFEPLHGSPSIEKEDKWTILHLLNRSEVFENFLHIKYVGHKRFSIEGAETLIPMIWTCIEEAAAGGAQEVILGMAHRGRVNVLANILHKSLSDIFAEFEEHEKVNANSGDVKYHKGFVSQVTTKTGTVDVRMAPNPSHLESVGPVIEGMTRAKEMLYKDTKKILPLLIHGDAAISGQGVVYETLQMSKLPAYTTGGTIHLVINNHIGFTTLPEDGRSTAYCTDIAKAFGMPVFHVNAEDPETCVWAIRAAVRLRNELGCDVWIDCNSWRKWGHNEADEPAYTQPLLYQVIREKKSIRELYHDFLMSEGSIEKKYAEGLESEFRALLQTSLEEFRQKGATAKEQRTAIPKESVIPKVTVNDLRRILETLTEEPPDFFVHNRLHTVFEERRKRLKIEKDFTVDWGLAESLAFATLLSHDVSVRLAGQDSRRGTFSHRHGMLVCQKSGKRYFPLSQFAKGTHFELWDSFLSEYAALGFEYGFSVAAPNWLTVWEAQFGDFANGAQVVIDQYISSGEQKWGASTGVTLLLPHGYEGQGPEHSSARMERFLVLAAQNNMIIAVPTTTGQFFHLLRRQGHSAARKPLIIFTPKGLLRFEESFSTLNSCASELFLSVIEPEIDPKKVQTVAFCAGRVYYDLISGAKKAEDTQTAIVRIEQIYPFPKMVAEILAKYANARRIFWVQEEPKNMGAWSFISENMRTAVPSIEYIGRDASASPACGSDLLHKQQQEAIIHALFQN